MCLQKEGLVTRLYKQPIPPKTSNITSKVKVHQIANVRKLTLSHRLKLTWLKKPPKEFQRAKHWPSLRWHFMRSQPSKDLKALIYIPFSESSWNVEQIPCKTLTVSIWRVVCAKVSFKGSFKCFQIKVSMSVLSRVVSFVFFLNDIVKQNFKHLFLFGTFN